MAENKMPCAVKGRNLGRLLGGGVIAARIFHYVDSKAKTDACYSKWASGAKEPFQNYIAN